MKFHVALFIVTTTIAAGSAAAQSQKPTDPSHDSQHHEMMQGLTDAPFVQMMSKHHQQGIEMARMEEERGASASVKQLATKIRQSQEKELAELKGHSEHHAGATGTSGSSEHDKMMDQQGQAMMSSLKSASGAALDHAFLEQMAKHHQMAISMTESAKLQDPALKTLALKMIAGQRQELNELKKELSSHGAAK